MAIYKVRRVRYADEPVVFVLPLGIATRYCWHVIFGLTQADRGKHSPRTGTHLSHPAGAELAIPASPKSAKQQLLASDMLVLLAPALLVPLVGSSTSERPAWMHSFGALGLCQIYR